MWDARGVEWTGEGRVQEIWTQRSQTTTLRWAGCVVDVDDS